MGNVRPYCLGEQIFPDNKWEAFKQKVEMKYHSYLFGLTVTKSLSLASAVVGVTIALVANQIFPILLAMGCLYLPKLYSRYYAKQILNETGLSKNIVLSQKGEFSWFNPVIPNRLTVGALLLSNYEQLGKDGEVEKGGQLAYLKKQGVTHILSVNEKEEFGIKKLSRPENLEKLNDKWKHSECPDHIAPSTKNMQEAVEWLRKVLQENPDHHVYIHCKSGKGRSVITMLAYLMQYEQPLLKIWLGDEEINVDSVYNYIKKNFRPEIHTQETQLKFLRDYLKMVNQKPLS